MAIAVPPIDFGQENPFRQNFTRQELIDRHEFFQLRFLCSRGERHAMALSPRGIARILARWPREIEPAKNLPRRADWIRAVGAFAAQLDAVETFFELVDAIQRINKAARVRGEYFAASRWAKQDLLGDQVFICMDEDAVAWAAGVRARLPYHGEDRRRFVYRPARR